MNPNKITAQELVSESARRSQALAIADVYDPERGIGCFGRRQPLMVDGREYRLPPGVTSATGAAREAEDFEYWAYRYVRVRDKVTGREVPLRLNRGQRRLLASLETQRYAARAIRTIVVKARQWGASTLVQSYIAWFQLARKSNWNSYVAAQNKTTARTLMGMFEKTVREYLTPDGEHYYSLKPFMGSSDTRVIVDNGNRITIGTAQSQDAARGQDLQMVHLSEVAYWPKTRQRDPRELVRAVCSSVFPGPDTLVVIESTANGVGNFFHEEWDRANTPGQSDMDPVFVPWYMADHYSLPLAGDTLAAAEALWNALNEYERALWLEHPITLEQLNWYHNKRLGYQTMAQMQAEYPSTAKEAFMQTGDSVFPTEKVAEQAERIATEEPPERGDLRAAGTTGREALTGIGFMARDQGTLEVWAHPDPGPWHGDGYSNRYVVGVDIGGRAAASDWSVITVIDRLPALQGGAYQVAAQWRGHIDHDQLAWLAAQIATYYCEALLVVEANTLEGGPNGGVSRYILDTLWADYGNLYLRRVSDIGADGTYRPGFHTNRATKASMITNMIRLIRDDMFVERSALACQEFAAYTLNDRGVYGARPGSHDDMVMSRAIALEVCRELC